MDREQLIEFLRENLRVELTTTNVYTGGMDDGCLYKDIPTVRLILCGDVISEATA